MIVIRVAGIIVGSEIQCGNDDKTKKLLRNDNEIFLITLKKKLIVIGYQKMHRIPNLREKGCHPFAKKK